MSILHDKAKFLKVDMMRSRNEYMSNIHPLDMMKVVRVIMKVRMSCHIRMTESKNCILDNISTMNDENLEGDISTCVFKFSSYSGYNTYILCMTFANYIRYK